MQKLSKSSAHSLTTYDNAATACSSCAGGEKQYGEQTDCRKPVNCMVDLPVHIGY